MEYINNFLWSIATVILVLSGIYFSYKLNFIHLNIFKVLKSLKNNNKNNTGISPFSSLMVSMGGCIGVGSLAGISIAIFKGGVGTIFWILISCLIMAPNSIAENTLAVFYHEKNNNNYIGGPAYYIKNGLGYKKVAFLYSIIVCIAYLFGFLTIQSNTISSSITNFYNIPNYIIGIIIGVVSFIIIKNGIKGIASFSKIFVPLMGMIYLFVIFLIVIKNINMIPNIILSIVNNAFNTTSLKYGVLSSFIIGIQRGIFASEIGSGTTAIASGSSNINNPFKQGLISVIGVYFIIFIICLGTALIILTSDYNPINYSNINGIEITLNSLVYHLGNGGNIVLYFSLIAFSFSTIISGYYYVEANLKFIFRKISDKHILILKIITCFLLIIATIVNSNYIWNISDILVAILVIINIFCILFLQKDVSNAYLDYKISQNVDK